MAHYILSLGSSHHHGAGYIKRAIDGIVDKKIARLCGQSRIYKNGASMTTYNSAFYNCALAVSSAMHPQVLYRELFALELALGRVRTYRNARRTIDIDIVMSLGFTYKSSNFYLPHKEALNRIFFVLPAIEALKSAGWQLPISVVQAATQFGLRSLWPIV